MNDSNFKNVSTLQLSLLLLPQIQINASKAKDLEINPTEIIGISRIEDDLDLSTDSDPFQTDDETNDPDFEIADTSVKRTTFKALSTSNSPSNSKNEVEIINEKGKVRKRLRREETWNRNVIKSRRNKGEEDIDWIGNKREARKMKEPCTNCRLKCPTKINLEQRETIFKEYWDI